MNINFFICELKLVFIFSQIDGYEAVLQIPQVLPGARVINP
jgi:hypothetical protein